MKFHKNLYVAKGKSANGKSIRVISYRPTKGQFFTKKQIMKIALRAKNTLKEGVIMQILLHTPDGIPKEWLPGSWFGKNDKIDEHDMFYKHSNYDDMGEDMDFSKKKFDRFNLTFMSEKPKKAGYDTNNDCVYTALKTIVPINKLMWKTPEEFKKFLGVERGESNLARKFRKTLYIFSSFFSFSSCF